MATDASAPGAPPGEDRLSVPIGWVGTGQGVGPVFVTLRAGLFAREGLDVVLRTLPGAPAVVRALAEGAVQFGNFAAHAVIGAGLEGADLVFVTGGINQQFLVGRRGLDDVQQLTGGTLGLNSRQELGYLFSLVLLPHLEAQGITGIQTAFGYGEHEVIEALAAGTADAAILTPPAAMVARQRGARFLLDFADLGLNFTVGGLVTRRRTIAAQPDLVRRVVRAYVAGLHRYKTDPAFATDAQQEYSQLTDRTIAAETVEASAAGFPRAPYPVTSGIAILLEALRRVDPRAEGVDASTFVDDRFVRELDASGYIAALYD
jgi:NitT/TauT family transport system substrate-binding protein